MTRWWAPDGPVPVEAMLKPGKDPQKDLGLALFGLHRAGAEACELVARTAVADEFVLAAALAETRALVAPAAVQTVSKAVGGPQYAGLLLADVLDDAEVAALALYRTCLAKSVAPPIAAQRVGMVFGLPSRELARYATLASDPKANPRAVEDLADRTLFGYVSKLVSEEYTPEPELVSKASTRTQNPYEDDHNIMHGQHGQYVREEVLPGTSLQEMFDQAEARTEETAGPKVAAPKQMKRMKRMKRAVRAEPGQQVAPQRVARQRVDRQSVLQQKLTAQQVALQELVPPLDPSPMPLATSQREVGDLLAAKWDASTGTPLGQPISFILPDPEYLAVARAAGDLKTGEHVLRIGGLEKYAGKARLYEDGRGDESNDHVAGVEMVVDLIKDQAKNQAGIITAEIPASSLLTGNPDQALATAKLRFLNQLKSNPDYAHLKLQHINPASEVGSVDNAPAQDDKDTMVLIYRPATAGVALRTIPRIVELVVSPGAVTGTIVGNRVTLDGNSPVRMKSLFHRGAGNKLGSQTFWDKRLGAIRSKIVLTKAGEDDVHTAWKGKGGEPTSKADSDYLDEHNVVNDPNSGRFVAERERTVVPGLQEMFDQAEQRETRMAAPSATPRRMARMKRMKRAVRAPEGQQAVAPQQVTGQQVAPQRALRQAVERQKIREKTDPQQGLAWFDDDTAYTAVTPQLIAAFVQHGFPEDSFRPVLLSHAHQNILRNSGVKVGQAAELEVEKNAEQAWASQVIRDRHGNVVTANEVRLIDQVIDPDQFVEVAHLLNDTVKGKPEVSMFRVEMKPVEGRHGVHLRVYRNHKALPVQHVFRYSEDADTERPERIVPEVGTKRMQNEYTYEHWLRYIYASMQTMDGKPVENTIANPRVKSWLVE